MPFDQPLDDTWHSRDLPVLRAVVASCDRTQSADCREVVEAVGLDEEAVNNALWALTTAELIKRGPTAFGGRILRVASPTGEARRLAGQWPRDADTALERMIAALDAIADNTDDTDTRTRAQKMRELLVGGGKSIGLAMATTMATGMLPGQ